MEVYGTKRTGIQEVVNLSPLNLDSYLMVLSVALRYRIQAVCGAADEESAEAASGRCAHLIRTVS